jgi:hypothetical protein
MNEIDFDCPPEKLLVTFCAVLTFACANRLGEAFRLPSAPSNSSVEFRFGKHLLICRCVNLDKLGAPFESAKTYNVRVELLTGGAYGVTPKVGDPCELVSPPDFIAATGSVSPCAVNICSPT